MTTNDMCPIQNHCKKRIIDGGATMPDRTSDSLLSYVVKPSYLLHFLEIYRYYYYFLYAILFWPNKKKYKDKIP